jgi:hypothetical protein
MPSSEILRRAVLVRSHIVSFRNLRRLPVTANVVPSSPSLITLMMEALRSSETLVSTRGTRRNILGFSYSISSQRASVASYCQRCSYLTDFRDPDDGGTTFPRNFFIVIAV